MGVGFKILVWSCSVPQEPPFPGPPFPEPPFPWTAQNLALFSLSRLHFVLFLSLSKCLLVESIRGRRGFTRQPENSKRAHLSVPALQTPPKVHEKTPREGRKERILRKKSEKFRPPTLWAPPFGSPPFRPTPSELPPPLTALPTPTPYLVNNGTTHDNSTHTKKTDTINFKQKPKQLTPQNQNLYSRCGAKVGVAPKSVWRQSRCGAKVGVAPKSVWRQSRCGAKVGVAPKSVWRQSRFGAKIHLDKELFFLVEILFISCFAETSSWEHSELRALCLDLTWGFL